MVLWTGGKDCCLALHRVREAGWEVVGLVTFVPEGEAEFHAHPLPEMAAQAQALGLPWQKVTVSAPFREGYQAALRQLRAHGADAVVTGDIDRVEGHPNWITECAVGTGLQVILPLWQEAREVLMEELLRRGIRARIQYLNRLDLPREWLGREIDPSLLAEMQDHSARQGWDLCGENGEYHTMVEDLGLRFP